jgi:phage tail-like protein
MNALYLPPVARPPHDPRTLTLDARLGWHAAPNPLLSEHTIIEPESQAVELSLLAGSGRLLSEPSGSFGGLTWPEHVAPLPDGSIVLLDRAAHRLLVLDRCACSFAEWPCLRENDLRVPREVTAVAVVCGQLLLLAPGLNRIIALNARTGALRGVWSGPHGDGLQPWTPTSAAVTCDRRVLVADPANGAVHILSPRGAPLDSIGGLGSARALAVDREDRVYVGTDDRSAVLIVDLARKAVVGKATRPGEIRGHFDPLPIDVFADGAIDIARMCMPPQTGPTPVDTSGHALPATHADGPVQYDKSGTWLSAPLDSEIAACVWDRITLTGRLPAESRIEVETLSAETVLLDDELSDPRALWRSAGVWRAEDNPPPCASTDFMLHSPPGRYLWLRLRLRGNGGTTPRVDCMLVDFPRVSLRRYLPAFFGTDAIAAEFTDRWLAIFDRTIRDIEGEMDGQAALLDPLAAPAYPDVPRSRDFLEFLASWVGVTLFTAWPLERRRHVLKNAPRIFAWRGTVHGIRDMLYLFLGLDKWVCFEPSPAECVPCPTRERTHPRWRPPYLVLEHFRLRRWLALGHARLSDAAKLWGERIVNRSRLENRTELLAGGSTDGARVGVTQLKTSQDPHRDPFHVYAHKMSIFVPAACARRPGLQRALQSLVATEKPAHVQTQLVFVEPRFRVGVQAMLGLDAVIGVRPEAPVLDSMRLGHGVVLGASGDRAGAPQPPKHVGAIRVGMTTVLN